MYFNIEITDLSNNSYMNKNTLILNRVWPGGSLFFLIFLDVACILIAKYVLLSMIMATVII